jgi:hypothetical protein
MESSAVREGGKPYIECMGLVNIYKTILVMGVEELLIMRIENDLRALRLKTKSQDTVAETIKPRFVRLKKINPELV